MFDLDRFIADCRAALAEHSPRVAIREIVERAVSEPRALERVLGTPERGGIFTLHRSPELTIIHFIWPPGIRINPHDHRMWAVNGLYGGREDNIFYRRAGDGLVPRGGRTLAGGDTTILGRSVIHAVRAPLPEYTGAIHVYGGDFFAASRSEWDPETGRERPWDIDRTKGVFEAAEREWRAPVRPSSPTS